MTRFAVLLLVAPLAAACTTARAQMPIEHPALEVPPAPPRVIEPMPKPEATQPEPVPDLTPERTASKPRPQAQRDASRSENKPETAPAVEPPMQGPQPTAPVPPLRTGTVEPTEAKRQVQEIITRARATLGNTNFGGLTQPLQALYNNAKAFLDQSEQAVTAENYELARKLAEKAETIANELRGR